MHQPATLNWAIGEYVMESVIRAGGRATMYTARRRDAEGLRALKVIAIGAHQDARTIAEAERRGAELQQAFARQHGLVPWVEEIGETRSCLYVAMELVPGEDLFDILTRGPLAPPHALEIAIELATFLEKAHGFDAPGRGPERIIHADLKPGNVRVRPDGHISVLDFGIAKAMAERRLETTQKWGTRQYMSPEWLQTGTIDEQVDYWALGVLLYEMVAGYRPFRRFERHENQLEDAIRRRERPEALPASIDLAIQRVAARLLAPEVRQRYPNATAIRAALESCRRDVPTLPIGLARREDVATERVTMPGGAGVPFDTPPTEPVPAPLRSPGVGSAALVPVAMREDTPPTERVPGAGLEAGLGAGVAGGSGVALPPPLPSWAIVPQQAHPAAVPASGAILDATFAAPVSVPAAWSFRVAGRQVPLRRFALGAACIFFAAILAMEGIGCIAAEQLRSEAAVADEAHLDAALKRRVQLAGWTPLDIGLHLRADPVIKGRLLSLADVVLANYRQEQPTVGRADWEQARAWLMNAVGLYPEDRTLVSKLRYTEGHLQRLFGLRRTELNQTKNARQSYYAAIQKFQEAASLDPKSPDPYLGLTHTYIYGLGDVDAALDAQKAAEKRGYRPNRRERAALGDGYRARGERTWRSARDLDGDQQRDAYERAQRDFKRCVEAFGPIVEFANAADQLHRCEARLAELDNHKTPWWKRLFGSQPEFEIHLPDLTRPEADRAAPDRPDTARPDTARPNPPRPRSSSRPDSGR